MSNHEGECLTCRWWRNPVERYPADWGHCDMAWAESGKGPALLNGLSPMEPTTLAMGFDGEQYMAGLATHETFGCVQWSKREPAE